MLQRTLNLLFAQIKRLLKVNVARYYINQALQTFANLKSRGYDTITD